MSKNAEIIEVTLTSDDEDEPVPTKRVENVVTTTTTTEEKKEDESTSSKSSTITSSTDRFAILKETLDKPALNNDADSDCEITEIPIEIKKENIPEIPPPVVKSEATSSEKLTNYKSVESDEEITEIVVINKSKNTTKTTDDKLDVDKPAKEEEENTKEVKVEEKDTEKIVPVKKTERVDCAMIAKEAKKEPKIESEVTKNSNDKRMKCCNADCNVFGYNFTMATSFMKAFYAVNESKDQVHKFCEKCVTKFEEYYVVSLNTSTYIHK
jgi:hypothetical protein